MSEAEQEKPVSQQVALPLEWHVSEYIRSCYADNVVVQARSHDIIISFFESQIPPFVGNSDEGRTLYEKAEAIRAECVGKIVVAPDLVPEIIQALQSVYEDYLVNKGV